MGFSDLLGERIAGTKEPGFRKMKPGFLGQKVFGWKDSLNSSSAVLIDFYEKEGGWYMRDKDMKSSIGGWLSTLIFLSVLLAVWGQS
jgi:hypothetical protein